MPIWIEQDPEKLEREKQDANYSGYEPDESTILLGEHPSGETVAHEIGHAVLKHRREQFETSEDMARNEMAAWVWAWGKRKSRQGGRIRSNIVASMSFQLQKYFPDLTEDEIIQIIQEAYEQNNVEPPDDDYIRQVIEATFEAQNR